MSFVAIDIGASNTRFVNSDCRFSTIPNNATFIQKISAEGKWVPDMVPTDLEPGGKEIFDSLEMIINHPGVVSPFFPCHALLGFMSDSSNEGKSYPIPLQNKYDQQVNYLSCITACAISKLQSNLDDNIELFIALPPMEIELGQPEMKKNLVGPWEVTFPKFNGGTTVKFNITDVLCSQEGVLAMTSFFFDLAGIPRQDTAKYGKKTILSIDIGASTTDLAIMQNGRVLSKSVRTYKVGGNDARDHFYNIMQKKVPYDFPMSEADRGMIEGVIQAGADVRIVSEEVEAAKRLMVAQLYNKMVNYFSTVGIPLQTIQTIVVSGGGSMQSQYVDDNNVTTVTSRPLSEFLTETLRSKVPDITVEVINHSDNPRMANITGLYLRARAMLLARSQAANN